VIVSSHPGLKNNDEKQIRIKEDQKWAEKFLTLNWKKLLTAWDVQAVFCGAKFNLPRREESYQRMELAQILDVFSLGRQPDFSNYLKGLDVPVLYVSGEKDIKYTQLGQNLVLNSKKMKHLVVPQVGHRVFWEGFFDQKFDRIKMFLEE
jgi:2-succinyl-6-hydroxy-2,4-cyclohexadiene-1-carboxylate synthase